MAEPLPDGFVDTGVSKTITVSGKGQFLHLETYRDAHGLGGASYHYNNITFGPWLIWAGELVVEGVGGEGLRYEIRATLQVEQMSEVNDLLESVPVHVFEEGFYLAYGVSRAYAMTYSEGPFRLGVRFEPISPDPSYPTFFTDYRLVYRWFKDAATEATATVDGYSHSWSIGSDPPEDAGATIGFMSFQSYRLDWGAFPTQARFTDLTLDGGPLDTSELDINDGDFRVLGTGEGAVDILVIGSGNNGEEFGAWALPPYRVTYDVDVTKNGGGSTRARLLDSYVVPVQLHSDDTEKQPQADYLTCPIRESYVIPITSWETHKKTAPGAWYFDVQPEWAEDQWYPWRTDDLRVALLGAPARSAPGPAVGDDPDTYTHPTYAPVTISLAPTVNVQRPDGRYPPNCTTWESTDEEKITVTDPKPGVNSATLIEVEETGGAIRRVFGETGTDLPVWRRWCGVGAAGKDDPQFHPDRVQLTKHSELEATNQDIFGWESYAFLRLGIDAPEAGTLTLQVEGMHLAASDNHVNNLGDRETYFTLTETPFSVTYDFDVAEGANSVEIDLLFPTIGASGIPFYPGRVDALELSGFEVGDCTLTELKLEAQGDSYFKVDWGPPVQRGDYSVMGWSNAGSFGTGGLPDQANKPEEVGKSPLAGGNLRYVYIVNSLTEPIIIDSQFSLGAFLGQLGGMEGWSYDYSEAAFAAANTDPYDVSLGPELAQNVNPQVPFRELTPGVGYAPRCNWTCRQMVLTNAQPFVLYTRWPLGHAGREVVVTMEDGRAPAGVGVKTYDGATGAILATGGHRRVGGGDRDADTGERPGHVARASCP